MCLLCNYFRYCTISTMHQVDRLLFIVSKLKLQHFDKVISFLCKHTDKYSQHARLRKAFPNYRQDHQVLKIWQEKPYLFKV